MKRWRILTIGSTDVLLHPAVFLFMLYAYWIGHFTFTLLAFISIILHETAHGIVAALCGHPPVEIEITPLGAVMRQEDISHATFIQRLVTILAGPAFTLLVCTCSLLVAKTEVISLSLARQCFLCNWALLVMNILPFLPLDGGRLLHLILEQLLPRGLVVTVMRAISYVGGLFFILLNLCLSLRNGGWNLSLAFAGCCIIYNASTFMVTQAMEELRYFVDRKILLERSGILPISSYAVTHTTPLRKLIRMLPGRKYAVFQCTELGSQKPLGRLDETEIIHLYLQEPSQTIGEALFSLNK